MKVVEILKELPELSIEDLRKINNILLRVLKLKIQMLALEFSSGDEVTWDSKKYGKKSGTVTSVRGKTVHVLTPTGENWRVSAGLLVKD